MSGILETLKFLGSSWLEVAVAVDNRLETQAARIAELEAALHAIVKICLVTSPYPGKDAQKMQSIAMATLIACDCAGQCKHYGECISDARAALEGGKDE